MGEKEGEGIVFGGEEKTLRETVKHKTYELKI
jgi:hypothetical protein